MGTAKYRLTAQLAMPLYAIIDDLMYRISLKNTTLILEEKHGLKSTWKHYWEFLRGTNNNHYKNTSVKKNKY